MGIQQPKSIGDLIKLAETDLIGNHDASGKKPIQRAADFTEQSS